MKKIILILVVASVFIAILTSNIAAAKSIEVMGIATSASQGSPDAVVAAAEISDYENAVAAMINNARVENGLNALAFDNTLNEVADIRSNDLINRNYFSHYTPEGTNVFDVMRELGAGFKYAGENLAQASPAGAGTADGFLNAWMASPTHKANILREQYTKIGVSMVEVDGRRVVTTVFTN